MSILKTKAILAHKRYVMMNELDELEVIDASDTLESFTPTNLHAEDQKQKKTAKKRSQKPNSILKKPKSANNIVKNYSRALVNFALAKVAKPYLKLILNEKGLTFLEFQHFIDYDRRKVNCIKSLRNKLLITIKDCDTIVKCKNAFQNISVIFIKMFSVNWIYNSKISDKRTHLMCRFKILSRIKNPEYFTYLESPKVKVITAK